MFNVVTYVTLLLNTTGKNKEHQIKMKQIIKAFVL